LITFPVAFRDSTVIVLETNRTHVRAVLGLAELLKTPVAGNC
jgi:hypothetical protein